MDSAGARYEVPAIECLNFCYPRNDTQTIVQSHRDGVYAYNAAEVDQPEDLRLVAYIHYEQMLGVMAAVGVPLPQVGSFEGFMW